MVDKNYWNEQFRLSPRQSKYHHENHTFRKAPVDLDMVAYQERQDNFNRQARTLEQHRQESQDRYLARKLERSLI